MKRATILTTNENSEKRGQIQNISQQKINTKTPKNAYNLNVGKIVGLNVGKRKLQKAPTNTDYRITKKQYQNSEKRHVFKTLAKSMAKSMANENSQKRHALRRNFTYQNSLSNTEYPKWRR